MEYELGTKLDNIDAKLDMLLRKAYPEQFKEETTTKTKGDNNVSATP